MCAVIVIVYREICCYCDSIQGEMCAVSVIVYREMCCYCDSI